MWHRAQGQHGPCVRWLFVSNRRGALPKNRYPCSRGQGLEPDHNFLTRRFRSDSLPGRALGSPVTVIHAVRNPYGAIATMHRHNGAPIADRLHWYAAHCESVAALCERLTANRFLHSHHEDLLLHSSETISNCCRFLGVSIEQEHLAVAGKIPFSKPRNTRDQLRWSPAERLAVEAVIGRFEWLSRYSGGFQSSGETP